MSASGFDTLHSLTHYQIAQQIAGEFPEYAADDGIERLFAFLFSPYDRLPDREAIYREAMDLIEWEAREQ